jgi:hypothetical protein
MCQNMPKQVWEWTGGGNVLIVKGEMRTQAALACTTVALAAERFRRDRGLWPGSLAELVPAYLGAMPRDPFDGLPLRFRRTADGLVIYSIGPDGTDDGGNLTRTLPPANGTDLGIRLWDPERRRQPPPPLLPADTTKP